MQDRSENALNLPGAGSDSGLYQSRFEHDACGFGMFVQLDDQPQRRLVDAALEALNRLTHRGAIAPDGLTGDGCGILLRKPNAYLRALAKDSAIVLSERFASGLVFVDPNNPQPALDALRVCLLSEALPEVSFREVPTDHSAIGAQAKLSVPAVWQVYVSAPGSMLEERFERALFIARRKAELALLADAYFYVVSLSQHSFGYKGMVMPSALKQFFPDLQRPDVSASAVLFHQRFSTNTLPQWRLAHPFRVLAHNGEINSIEGNRSWMRARGAILQSPVLDFRALQPVVSMHGSDSQSLDNMLEALLLGGLDLLCAIRILLPPAWRDDETLSDDARAFYEYFSLPMEPWDGPAGLVMLDQRFAACCLDRNGLRPARWLLTRDRVLAVASEAGVFDVPARDVIKKGRLGPSEMLAVDFRSGELLNSRAIDSINAARAPFGKWLREGVTNVISDLVDPNLAAEPFPQAELVQFQRMFGLTREERDSVLKVLAEAEVEATGSMGDDTPMAVLSHKPRSLYDYFRQAFAQVTNPPIDSLREHGVMSLVTPLGAEGNVFELDAKHARMVVLNSPILSQRKLRQLVVMPELVGPEQKGYALLDLYYAPELGLKAAIAALCLQAETKVSAGVVLLLLSDRYPKPGLLPVHALMATGAIHAHLIAAGLRCQCNLLIETGTARDAHHFACLIGFGATAVYPYLAYQTLYALKSANAIHASVGDERQLGRSYRRGIRKGLLKIIAKMGISTIDSYRGAQLFEIVGLRNEVVALCFPHTVSRIGGASFADLQADQARLSAESEPAPPGVSKLNPQLDAGGLLKFVQGGEYHAYNPDVINTLQEAVRSGDYAIYQRYAEHVDTRKPAMLRDLLALKPLGAPISIDEVEPEAGLLKRFDSAGMSLGALSPEAHEALAIAMNRLGARSNSGEGGEDPARYGTEKSSKIKQVASGRFGVTAEYLINAEVLQIKIAQGAKPGEGGQLPGHKVDALIARLRFAKPGIGLISPPPHHDIYSIEDLAQLIFDLKEINPQALVSVKLVSHAGVGTIAAGVAKCYADLITISGYDGGTGASPLSSIKYAGTPWELGLAETQQTLRRNGLRGRVRVQTDGGLKTGLDVLKAAALGAESFGFGTAPMVALGCKYLRICHLNNCATGIATQHPTLRKQFFIGLPEMVENYFRFIVRDVRERMAALGIRRIEELVGRTDLLAQTMGDSAKQRGLDLSPLLSETGLIEAGRSCARPDNPPHDQSILAKQMLADMQAAIDEKSGGTFSYSVQNHNRSIGARLSGAIARKHGNYGMRDAPITLKLRGSAGQSLGVWNAGGLHIELEGEANDYVGKGMADGKIIVYPPADAGFIPREAAIIGNTCLYGATGGELYAAGLAGERFAVRNSGATAVVEGTGAHACEYMTGGVVLVLGRTGLNFGAGFTGGFAYVLDIERDFVDRYNHELIDITRVSPESLENHVQHLDQLIATHIKFTGSAWAKTIAADFRAYLPKFWLVKPKAASLQSLIETLKRAA